MKAIAPLRRLVAACAASVALAQPPPQPLPAGLQKLINAPVWYLNYSLHLRIGNSGSMSRERVTSGQMMLGLRSSGPSLSIAANPGMMVITAPEQLDALIANYANWISGVNSDDTKTDQENEAILVRVRQDNLKAFERHHWQYNLGSERASANGSGTIMHAHEPALEFDAAKRRWKLLFDVRAFTDSMQTVNAFVGIQEYGVGTKDYRTEAIKTGIRTGDQGVQSVQPPLGDPYFEGRLPDDLGNISYSATHQVKEGIVPGTLSIQLVLSPYPPEDVELIIEPPANYEQWLPVAGDNEKAAGDRIPITVLLQKRGGGTPRLKLGQFIYRLWNTSHEKGVCLNWPLNPEANSPPDFQFELDANPHVVVDGDDRQKAVETPALLTATTGSVVVSCFDYGAYSEFEAVAKLENGQLIYGVVKGRTSGEPLKLPDCKEGSKIAKAFLSAHGVDSLEDKDDGENDPVGDGFKGDGFTLYEEYRGFMHGDEWTSCNPKKKDVFVLNLMHSSPAVGAGISIFKSVTSLEVHRLLRVYQVKSSGLINFNHTAAPHLTEQHVIRIMPGTSIAQGATFANALGVGPPRKAQLIRMPADLGQHRGEDYFAMTIAHEMLHCCNVFHHGEGDPVVMWSYRPPGNQFYENAGAYSHVQGGFVRTGAETAITVKHENGSVVLPADFFPSGKTEGPIDLGIAHGLHSGSDYCLMRYAYSMAYVATADPSVRYLTGSEPMGTGLCNTRNGTGVNGSRTPQPRYGWAATVLDGVPGVVMDRGDCEHQIRVSDSDEEPAPPDR